MSPVQSVLLGDVGVLLLVKWRVHLPVTRPQHATQVIVDANIDSSTVMEQGQHLCNKKYSVTSHSEKRTNLPTKDTPNVLSYQNCIK